MSKHLQSIKHTWTNRTYNFLITYFASYPEQVLWVWLLYDKVWCVSVLSSHTSRLVSSSSSMISSTLSSIFTPRPFTTSVLSCSMALLILAGPEVEPFEETCWLNTRTLKNVRLMTIQFISNLLVFHRLTGSLLPLEPSHEAPGCPCTSCSI